jgi:plastocyanin
MGRFGRRSLLAVTAFVAGLALAVVPTLGANVDVTSGPGETFSPKTVTVAQGDSVTWTNAVGFHNVKFGDGLFTQPSPPDSTAWKVSRTFTAAGTYGYYCEVHRNDGMTGTVVVTAPGSTTTPPPGGGGGGGPPGSGPPPTVHDTSKPKLKLSVRSVQRILRHRGLVISVRVDEKSTVTAKARITVPGASRVLKLRKATRKLAPGVRAKLKLRLSRKNRAAVSSALARRSRLRAKLTVTAKDAAGNRRSRSRSLSVRK